jgi:DNA mismatch repair protein MutS
VANATPLMSQYQAIKSKYPDCLLFFRLGDFYELFGDDAKKAAKELDIVLTSRGAGKEQKVPMCGVPYHAVENYLNRLLEKGYKVAICEQLEEAKPGKGIVKRDVVRVVTPGTILNAAYLDQANNNYILSLCHKQDHIGCAWSDISTGEFQVTQFSSTESCLSLIADISWRGSSNQLRKRRLPIAVKVRSSAQIRLPSFLPSHRVVKSSRFLMVMASRYI